MADYYADFVPDLSLGQLLYEYLARFVISQVCAPTGEYRQTLSSYRRIKYASVPIFQFDLDWPLSSFHHHVGLLVSNFTIIVGCWTVNHW